LTNSEYPIKGFHFNIQNQDLSFYLGRLSCDVTHPLLQYKEVFVSRYCQISVRAVRVQDRLKALSWGNRLWTSGDLAGSLP